MTDKELVRSMMKVDPDLNLFLLAFEVPLLEDAALEVAQEMSDEQPDDGDGLEYVMAGPGNR